MNGDLTFSPVSPEQPLSVTREQLKTIYKLTKGTTAACELVGHHSTTVELYIDPVEPSTTAHRYHITADGTYDEEQCEVPTDDGDWDWAPPGGWVEEPAPKVKKPKKLYLSDKFTVRNNPDPVWDQQFQHEEVRALLMSGHITGNQIWTVVEGDSGKLWALTGFHIVNRLHYAVTEEEWTKEDEEIDYKW